jgi:hypothetical protein
MPLRKVQIRPGFNKQATESDAMGQWTDGDFVRFRYGQPEKIGGWTSLVSGSYASIVGAARDQHVWSDLSGKKYSALGTDKLLVVYYEGAFYDITPLQTDNFSTGANITTTNLSKDVTITTASGHSLLAGAIITFANAGSFTSPDTDYTATDFDDVLFEVKTVPSATTFTIEMPTEETGTGATADGTLDVHPYQPIGPLNQTYGYGWGTAGFGGASGLTTTLNGALLDDTNGTGGTGTDITLTSITGFPTNGTIKVGAEFISFNGITGNNLNNIVRDVAGTRSAHPDGASVEFYIAWGQNSTTSTVTLDPANWSLDNWGEILIATIHNGKTFTWDPSSTTSLTTRAVVNNNMPSKSTMSIVSDRDRHLIHLGTETTIGSPGTQDKMFIRFSDQEDYNDYAPTSVNTAGTFQLDDGTKIVGACKGKDYIMIFTDTATYRLDFVGPPFTFSIRKVASNAGLIAQHAAVYANGGMWWIGATGGFYVYDGTVKSVPCLVEDFVFTNNSSGDLGINFNSADIVYAGINELYSEVNWFYPSSSSNIIDRCVTYNYTEQVWTTSSLDRTTWEGSTVYAAPFATDYQASLTPTYPTVNGVSNGATILYQHETGVNQENADGTETAISSYIQSGEFDITTDGEGQNFMSVSRFLPDFKSLSGDAQVTIFVNRYPQATATSSPLGPFTVTSSTTKIDTRARGRLAAVKIATDGLNESWRYGTFSFDVKPDGRR